MISNYNQDRGLDSDYRSASPASNAEPIHKPDHRAKRHGRPSKWHRLAQAGKSALKASQAPLELTAVAVFIGGIAIIGMGVGA